MNVLLVRFQTITLETRGRNNVSSTLFQHRDVNIIKLRLFQPPVFADYLFERQYRPFYEHYVPYVKEIPLQHIKNPEAVNESCSLKKTVFQLSKY